MRRKLAVAVMMLFGLTLTLGCAGKQAQAPQGMTPDQAKLLAEYPDHSFNPKAYIQGMQPAGHHLYLWMDPAADLSRYEAFAFDEFSTRHLPALTEEQKATFSYKPYAKKISRTLKDSLTVRDAAGGSTLLLKGAMVECSPGSRAARYLVGFGAGKSAGAVACEVYEPGKSKPVIRLYARDTGSAGAFGGDSVAMLNHIFEQVGLRVSSALETRIGR